jgi:hypothetical protein
MDIVIYTIGESCKLYLICIMIMTVGILQNNLINISDKKILTVTQEMQRLQVMQVTMIVSYLILHQNYIKSMNCPIGKGLMAKP